MPARAPSVTASTSDTTSGPPSPTCHAVDPTVPTYLIGWSFGADLALSVRDAGHAGWCAIALPLHWLDDAAATGADARRKLVLLAEHDEFRPAGEVQAVTATWTNTETEVIGGASHFFVGRTARLVERVQAWITTAS